MEKDDKELLSRLAYSNQHLKRLYDKHQKLEAEVKALSKEKSPVSLSKQIELKKQKLQKKDEIMKILSDYRRGEALAIM